LSAIPIVRRDMRSRFDIDVSTVLLFIFIGANP
jgi:hypothetical protein